MKDLKEKEVVIIVNGREKVVEYKKASYIDLVELAFGKANFDSNTVYTVTFSKGKNEDKGSLVEGDTLTLKKGMVINVTRTDKS
ncbi:multiubiquitin domain-containing protein [Planomicrobium okeanokoites]|uniref:multiubiquitin domain-containing protein n=1 Tax=Planomicrobium okeanokoites TaxID=244 RepID=UPI00248FD93D|nr:multiubiquitin domain-containing protein [Planomicrobium okeanokoites]